jgi:hypothetical protein
MLAAGTASGYAVCVEVAMEGYVTLRSILLRAMPSAASSYWIERAIATGRWPQIARGPNQAYVAPEGVAKEILRWADEQRKPRTQATIAQPAAPLPSPSQPPETERHLVLSLGPAGMRLEDPGSDQDAIALEIGKIEIQIRRLTARRDELLERANELRTT